MSGEERRERGKKRVCLMGTVCALLPEGTPPEKAELGVSRDPKAMELLALLVLGRELLPTEGIRDGSEVRRDWLAAQMYPDLFSDLERRQKAREKVRYHRDTLQEALGLCPAQEANTRERTVLRVSWADVRVDVLEIVQAAPHLHVSERQDEIIALGDRPLLEGMGYGWLDTPPFQQVRATLDGHYLAALARKADGLVVRMEAASARGLSDDADRARTAVIPLLDKATERLAGCRQPHAFAPKFADLQRRSKHVPTPEAAAPAPNGLPQPITSFVGREAEKAKIKFLLASERLVTLTGMGGCGKTRLALKAASEIESAGGCVVRLAELASVNDSTLVPQTVAKAFGLEVQDKFVEALIAHLQGKPALLLLDNCEHLIEACARLVETLLQACPDLKVLATSREPLKIGGERPFLVPPLGIPDPDHLPTNAPDSIAALLRHDAVQLFLDRMRPHREFALKPENVHVVAVICVSLDGIPLALELAAARVKMLSLEAIAEMLMDRFHLLTDGRRTALPRHKTLRAVIDWSYDLLTEQEKALLCRLSVFQGGWTLNAAEAVGASEIVATADVLELLGSLQDKSLITADVTASPDRYGMLETVRQYAQDRLREMGEWDETHRKHRDFCLRLAEQAAPQLRGPEQKQWMNRLETEHGNFRAALAWRADETALRLACALSRFWWVRGHFKEGRKWLERNTNDNGGTSEVVQMKALIGGGRLALAQGKIQDAGEMFEESLALSTQRAEQMGIADALHNLGDVSVFLGEYEDAKKYYLTSLMHYREISDKAGVANALVGLGAAEQNQGHYASAEARYKESLTLKQEIRDPQGVADSLMCLGNIAFRRGELTEAHILLEESLSLLNDLDSSRRIAECLIILGQVAIAQGEIRQARLMLEQSLTLSRTTGHQWITTQALNCLATIAFDQEDYGEAETLFRQCLALAKAMGAERFVTALLVNIGTVIGIQGRYAEAEQLFRHGLLEFWTLKDKPNVISALEGYAAVIAKQGRWRRTAGLLGASASLAEQIRFRRPANEDGRYNQVVSTTRETLGENAYAAALAEGQAMTWEQAVAFALEEPAP